MSAEEKYIEKDGVVAEVLPNAMFRVKLDNDRTILGHISGKLRMNYIRIMPGDTVRLQISPYDLSRGRIVWRGKSQSPNWFKLSVLNVYLFYEQLKEAFYES